jgi:hypothetical protein
VNKIGALRLKIVWRTAFNVALKDVDWSDTLQEKKFQVRTKVPFIDQSFAYLESDLAKTLAAVFVCAQRKSEPRLKKRCVPAQYARVSKGAEKGTGGRNWGRVCVCRFLCLFYVSHVGGKTIKLRLPQVRRRTSLSLCSRVRVNSSPTMAPLWSTRPTRLIRATTCAKQTMASGLVSANQFSCVSVVRINSISSVLLRRCSPSPRTHLFTAWGLSIDTTFFWHRHPPRSILDWCEMKEQARENFRAPLAPILHGIEFLSNFCLFLISMNYLVVIFKFEKSDWIFEIQHLKRFRHF